MGLYWQYFTLYMDYRVEGHAATIRTQIILLYSATMLFLIIPVSTFKTISFFFYQIRVYDEDTFCNKKKLSPSYTYVQCSIKGISMFSTILMLFNLMYRGKQFL